MALALNWGWHQFRINGRLPRPQRSQTRPPSSITESLGGRQARNSSTPRTKKIRNAGILLAALALIAVTLATIATSEIQAHRATGKGITLHSDNGQARGLWASGTHFYVSDPEDDHVYAYRRTDGERDTTKEISLHSDNQDAKGIWGDETHLWVADTEDKLLYAYSLQGGSRVATQDVTLQDANADARGLTGTKEEDGVRLLYVLDQEDNHVYAYKLQANTAAHNAYESFGIGDETNVPWGVRENADAHHGYYETAWVTNSGRIFAHDHEDEGSQGNSDYGSRIQIKDIRLDADNLTHRGAWSDGEFIWVVDEDDQKLYVYHLDSIGGTATSHASNGRSAESGRERTAGTAESARTSGATNQQFGTPANCFTTFRPGTRTTDNSKTGTTCRWKIPTGTPGASGPTARPSG